MDKRVLVLGAGTGASNNLIRSLKTGEASLWVVGAHDDRFVLKKSPADRNDLVPSPAIGEFRDALHRVIARERVDLVIPANDAHVQHLSHLRRDLPCRVFLPCPSTIDLCQDKYDLTMFPPPPRREVPRWDAAQRHRRQGEPGAQRPRGKPVLHRRAPERAGGSPRRPRSGHHRPGRADRSHRPEESTDASAVHGAAGESRGPREIPPSEKTMRAFLAGTLDFPPEVEPTYVERINANPSTRLVRAPTLSTYYLGFRVDRRPFSDLRVRQAVSRDVDVERAILFTSRGTGLPAFGPIPPGREAHDVTLKKSPFNPDAARQLLRASGHGDLRVSMLYNAGWGFFAELAYAIKADLLKVGVAVDLVPLPSYKELVTEIRRGKSDMFIYSWFTVLPDAEVWLGRLFPSKSIDNLTGYSNAQVDALLEQARGIADPSTRETLYRRVQRTIVDEVPTDRFARVDLRSP